MAADFVQLNDRLSAAMVARRHTLRRVFDDLSARSLAEGGSLMQLVPVPLLFDRGAARDLARDATALLDIQTRIMRVLLDRLGRDPFLDLFDVPPPMRHFVNWDELLAPQTMIARFDILETRDGFRFCEFNVDSCVAGAELYDYAVDCFAHLGVDVQTSDLVAPLEPLSTLLLDRARQAQASRVVILDVSAGGGSAGKGYFSFDRLRGYLLRQAGDVEVTIADETTYPPEWTRPDEARRTLVYRGFPMDEMTDGGAFLQALIDAGATVVNTYESEIRMNKIWFALLHDEAIQNELAPEDRDLVARTIPHTFALDDRNFAATMAAKDAYVFKRRRSYGGLGIYIGREWSRDELTTILGDDGIREWTAQRALDPLPVMIPSADRLELEPHNMVYGLFLYGTRANGMLVRASTSSRIVNVTTGKARIGWAMSVDEDGARALLAQLGGAAAQAS